MRITPETKKQDINKWRRPCRRPATALAHNGLVVFWTLFVSTLVSILRICFARRDTDAQHAIWTWLPRDQTNDWSNGTSACLCVCQPYGVRTYDNHNNHRRTSETAALKIFVMYIYKTMHCIRCLWRMPALATIFINVFMIHKWLHYILDFCVCIFIVVRRRIFGNQHCTVSRMN